MMEYTVQKLARLAGISARTLRYYDEIGLLRPLRINSSGYRIYGQSEVDQLQQILFYRELDMELDGIARLLAAPNYDAAAALKAHREALLAKKARLGLLIRNVEKTISMKEGDVIMSDREKFEGFKQSLIDENERKYGLEIREKYGEEQVERSNRALKEMTREQYEQAERLGIGLLDLLKDAVENGDPSGALARRAAGLHREWLSFYWDGYSPEAHMGLAQMYVDDPRFCEYYDKAAPGAAVFLRDAVKAYTARIR